VKGATLIIRNPAALKKKCSNRKSAGALRKSSAAHGFDLVVAKRAIYFLAAGKLPSGNQLRDARDVAGGPVQHFLFTIFVEFSRKLGCAIFNQRLARSRMVFPCKVTLLRTPSPVRIKPAGCDHPAPGAQHGDDS